MRLQRASLVFSSRISNAARAIVLVAAFATHAQAASPSEADFDLRKAFLIANACEITYLKDQKVLDTIKDMGIEFYQFANSEGSGGGQDTQVFLASTDHYTLICFRGTQGWRDWKTNLAMQSAPLEVVTGSNIIDKIRETGYVHGGFLSAWRDVEKSVVSYLAKRGATPDDPEGKRERKVCHDILLGGHSLGGALAILAGIDLKSRGYRVLGIYTFGSPRVATPSFRKMFDAHSDAFPKIHRYLFKDDVVPEIPPGFLHLGTEKYSSQMGTLGQVARSWWRWITASTVNLDAVADHSMENYVNTLVKIVTDNASDDTTRAMAAWLRSRDKPLTEYLGSGIPRSEATSRMQGFTDAREVWSCK